jgi:hypothetical protein
MKKVYSKPVIMFEDFSLSTNIAGSCDVDTNVQSQNQCGMDFSGVTVFLDTMNGCAIKVTSVGGDGEYGGICYHVFSNGYNLFNS